MNGDCIVGLAAAGQYVVAIVVRHRPRGSFLFSMDALTVLGEVGCQPGFKRWELHDTDEIMALEREELKERADLRVFELIHKAAYRRGGLGNTMYSPPYMVGKHSPEMMHEFAVSEAKPQLFSSSYLLLCRREFLRNA